ncbi:7-deoxyloganetin glucosyltransferase [Camellia lanceoleosa]|uniref:7-deoxyloganetin glucosyltransferase n=1 Tax=Camellia lanceoleosa TaxID=1840588 RepID=A0ACC0G9C0_9ERIC|nr:7-deoxyloganetin glucosyltransferase [Camellia lanceoleosa]
MPTREMSSQSQQKPPSPCSPHAVCIPCPTQDHINPMLKLAKLLDHKGIHNTFVNTEFNHRRLLKSQGHHSLSDTASFCFETIPDGLHFVQLLRSL